MIKFKHLQEYIKMNSQAVKGISRQEKRERAEFIKEHGELGVKLLEDYDLDYSKQFMEESYEGVFDNQEDFARHIVKECYELKGLLANYFDYKQFARDLFLDDYFAIDLGYHKLHVFNGNI